MTGTVRCFRPAGQEENEHLSTDWEYIKNSYNSRIVRTVIKLTHPNNIHKTQLERKKSKQIWTLHQDTQMVNKHVKKKNKCSLFIIGGCIDYSEIPLHTLRDGYKLHGRLQVLAGRSHQNCQNIIGRREMGRPLWSDGNILYLDRHLGWTGLCVCLNHQTVHLKSVELH